MSRRTIALAFSVVALATVSAAAEPRSDEDEARALETEGASSPAVEQARRRFQRGVEFYNAGDYKLSLVEFLRAYELSRHYRILYNIGQVNHQLNNYSKALASLERYLTEGGADVPEDRKVEVEAAIQDLRRKVARIELSVDVEDADVSIDDVALGRAGAQREIVVDAGDHRVEARRAGYLPARSVITLAAGDVTRVHLTLVPVKVAGAPRPAPRAPAPRRESSSSTLAWVGWIATGTLAAGAGVTGFLAVSRARDLEELRESPGSSPEDREAARDRARVFALTADVLAATAVAAGAVSLYFTLSSGSDEEAPSPRARLAVGPAGVAFVQEY